MLVQIIPFVVPIDSFSRVSALVLRHEHDSPSFGGVVPRAVAIQRRGLPSGPADRIVADRAGQTQQCEVQLIAGGIGGTGAESRSLAGHTPRATSWPALPPVRRPRPPRSSRNRTGRHILGLTFAGDDPPARRASSSSPDPDRPASPCRRPEEAGVRRGRPWNITRSMRSQPQQRVLESAFLADDA